VLEGTRAEASTAKVTPATPSGSAVLAAAVTSQRAIAEPCDCDQVYVGDGSRRRQLHSSLHACRPAELDVHQAVRGHRLEQPAAGGQQARSDDSDLLAPLALRLSVLEASVKTYDAPTTKAE